jgi:TonB family protein
MPSSPEFPPSMQGRISVPVKSQVLVTLDPQGKIENVALYKSSGFDALDDAALSAARKSTYAPTVVDCKPVDGGQYVFAALFTP